DCTGYPMEGRPEGNHSAADMALCYMVAFYTGDAEQIKRIFRQSGLYRTKWEREDYRTETISKALAFTHICYKGGYAPTNESPPQYLKQWNDGNPSFDEWWESNGVPKKPHPGRARQMAAEITARKYRKGYEPIEQPGEKKKPDGF